MNKKLRETLKTIFFIPSGIAVFILVLAITSGIDWLISQIIGSINPNKGNMLDSGRSIGMGLLALAAFVISCFGLVISALGFFTASYRLMPEYLPQRAGEIILGIIFLVMGIILFIFLFNSVHHRGFLFWAGYIIAAVALLLGGIFGLVSKSENSY